MNLDNIVDIINKSVQFNDLLNNNQIATILIT